jgi:hypothetical protein
MHWMSVKLADNFQVREHSWPCLFHISRPPTSTQDNILSISSCWKFVFYVQAVYLRNRSSLWSFFLRRTMQIELRISLCKNLQNLRPRLSRTFPGVSDDRTPSVRSQMCMFRFLKYISITLPYYLCKIIHMLLFITTNIWLQHNPAYSGRHFDNEILAYGEIKPRCNEIGFNYWLIDYCLTSSEQYFSYIQVLFR